MDALAERVALRPTTNPGPAGSIGRNPSPREGQQNDERQPDEQKTAAVAESEETGGGDRLASRSYQSCRCGLRRKRDSQERDRRRRWSQDRATAPREPDTPV